MKRQKRKTIPILQESTAIAGCRRNRLFRDVDIFTEFTYQNRRWRKINPSVALELLGQQKRIGRAQTIHALTTVQVESDKTAGLHIQFN